MTDTDRELADKLRGMTNLNQLGQETTQEAAVRVESRARAIQLLARVFRVAYLTDMAEGARKAQEYFHPLTVSMAEMLREDESSDAAVDYGAVNEVMGWFDGKGGLV
jgi:hypothetical protein